MSEEINKSQPVPDQDDENIISVDTDNENGAEHLKLRVSKSVHPKRIDKYLQGRFSNFSRTTIQKLIREKAVVVNGKAVKQSYQICPGDIVDFIVPPPEVKELIPEDIPLDVVYEDDDFVIINKQANLIVHPGRGNSHGTLVNALAYRFNNLSTGSDELRPGIVHRLDKNTTGTIVVAKNDTAHWRIARQFELRQTKKKYLAIVHGVPELNADLINQPIGVHARVREKYAVRPGGKESRTTYELVEEFQGYSLLKLTLHTGRTHQIRVHLSYIKHPVVADDMYGGKLVYPWQLENSPQRAEDPVIGRCALHAWQLGFKHPTTGKDVEFQAELPPDMKRLLEMLRTYRKKGTNLEKTKTVMKKPHE